MATSDRAYNQVKSILNKLDRSITDARDKRTKPSAPAQSSMATTEPQSRPAPASQDAPAAARPANSPYGRAQPLPPKNQNPPLRWGT